MGARLSETELQKSLDFCVQLFSPTSPEQHERVANSGVNKDFLDVNMPIMDPAVLEGALKVDICVDDEEVANERKLWNGYDRINGMLKAHGGEVNEKVGLETINDDSEGETPYKGNGVKLPPAVKRYDRRMKRSDSDAQKAAETKMVVNKINARRVVHSEYAINNFESEGLNGYVVRLERGKLGLNKIQSEDLN